VYKKLYKNILINFLIFVVTIDITSLSWYYVDVTYEVTIKPFKEYGMFNFEPILKENPNGVLATQDGPKVKTRVFQYLFSDGKKVYFCTNSEKPVYAQLKAHPQVSFCTSPKDFSPVLSVTGKAVFVEDIGLKTRALDENPGIKGIYKTHDNPIFKIFYIDVEEIETFSFTEGPKTYTL
jgi:uncharacterized pyridoxamine 5'-phosphate oxidase family protein